MPGELGRAGSALPRAGTDPCSSQDTQTATMRPVMVTSAGWRGPHGPCPWVIIAPCPRRLEGTRCVLQKWHRRGDTTVSLQNTAWGGEKPIKIPNQHPCCNQGHGPSLPWKTKQNSSDNFTRIKSVLPWLPRPWHGHPLPCKEGEDQLALSACHLSPGTCSPLWQGTRGRDCGCDKLVRE